MKKSFLGQVTLLIVSVAFYLPGCMTSSEKLEAAEDNVLVAKDQLINAREAYLVEFEAYRKETAVMIESNDKIINAFYLRIESEESEETKVNFRVLIADLKNKNEEMSERLSKYEVNGRDSWEKFKIEFNHDLDELGKALNDVTTDNVK